MDVVVVVAVIAFVVEGVAMELLAVAGAYFGAAGGPQARKAAKRTILRCFNIGILMLTGGSATSFSAE